MQVSFIWFVCGALLGGLLVIAVYYRWFKNRNDRENVQAFYESLSSSYQGRRYTKLDRYRDFKEVFSTSAGKRVLSEIIRESEGLIILENEAENVGLMAYRAGKRYIGAWIIKVISNTPNEPKGN